MMGQLQPEWGQGPIAGGPYAKNAAPNREPAVAICMKRLHDQLGQLRENVGALEARLATVLRQEPRPATDRPASRPTDAAPCELAGSIHLASDQVCDVGQTILDLMSRLEV